MVNPDFYTSFWANFWSTLLAGTIIGFVLTLVATRISRNKEKKIKNWENQITFSKKALSFIRFLKSEIDDIIVFCEFNKDKINRIDKMNYVRFNISYWEILKTSGEIPSLFEPITLQILTNFYDEIEKCNLLYEQFLDAENNGRSNIEVIIMREYEKAIQSVLTMINTTKIDLIADQEINNKQRDIETLMALKNKLSL